MRAPAFWQRSSSLAASLLGPAASLYGAVAGRNMVRAGARASVPVVCVGNFTVGGTGKTPVALALAEMLRALGERPGFLTRGYGGRLAGPVLVDPDAHSFREVGDEPLLLARAAQTVVARDRPEGARLCAESGASVIVMDDGLQNSSLAKDLAIAVVDGETGFGNGLTLPAGPLRAPLAAQWPCLHAVIVMGIGKAGDNILGEAEQRGKVAIRAGLMPDMAAMARLNGRRVLAFAGIGRPEKFFGTLEAHGVLVEKRHSFADHHGYRTEEVWGLVAEAAALGLDLVTTEKDLVRIEAVAGPESLARPIAALPIRVAFEDESGVEALLARYLPTRPPS